MEVLKTNAEAGSLVLHVQFFSIGGFNTRHFIRGRYVCGNKFQQTTHTHILFCTDTQNRENGTLIKTGLQPFGNLLLR